MITVIEQVMWMFFVMCDRWICR